MNLYSRILAEGREEERSLVAVERHNSHALVTLNDPERLNSLTPAIVVQLQDALAELAARSPAPGSDPHRPRPSLFSSGDLELIESAATEIQNAAQAADATDAWRWIRRQFGGVVRTIASTDKAFVAAINGPAAGVGLAFALACDLIIASEKAVLVPAFGRLGLVPEVGTSWLMTRRLGYHGAVALYVRGKHLEAEEALRLGLVQEILPHDDLLAGAERWCERVSRMPAHAFEMTKPLLRAAADADWEQSLKLEEYAEAVCFSTAALPPAAAAIKASGR